MADEKEFMKFKPEHPLPEEVYGFVSVLLNHSTLS